MKTLRRFVVMLICIIFIAVMSSANVYAGEMYDPTECDYYGHTFRHEHGFSITETDDIYCYWTKNYQCHTYCTVCDFFYMEECNDPAEYQFHDFLIQDDGERHIYICLLCGYEIYL